MGLDALLGGTDPADPGVSDQPAAVPAGPAAGPALPVSEIQAGQDGGAVAPFPREDFIRLVRVGPQAYHDGLQYPVLFD